MPQDLVDDWLAFVQVVVLVNSSDAKWCHYATMRDNGYYANVNATCADVF